MRKALFLMLLSAALWCGACDTRQKEALEARVDAVRDSADVRAETMEMPLDSARLR